MCANPKITVLMHYVLCQHGLAGSATDFARLVERFNHQDSQVTVIVLRANIHMFRTLDGVESAGNRCFKEICELIHSQVIPIGSTVSVLGHSMGGLYLRYAMRKIEMENGEIWAHYSLIRKYAVFIASPHCGVWSSSWIVSMSCNVFLKHIVNTARDVILASDILLDLTDAPGLAALNGFDRVILYGNQARDKVVSASSALVLCPSMFVLENASRQAKSDVMIITEFLHEHTEENAQADLITPCRGNEKQSKIVQNLNAGLKRVTRYLVDSPSTLPSLFEEFDNTAHTRIICHGLTDRNRVGLPMIEHLRRILGGTEAVPSS